MSILLQEAERAKAALDKKKVLGKKIVVDWARTDLGAAKKNVSYFFFLLSMRPLETCIMSSI